MDLLGQILAMAAVLVAGGAAVAAALQAREARRSRIDAEAARDESRRARDESVELARRAVLEAGRLADAQEELVSLKKREFPEPAIEWSLAQFSPSGWQFINVGDLVAHDALVGGTKVIPDEKEPRDVEPGDDLGFIVSKTMGPRPEVILTWTDHAGVAQSIKRTIR